MKKLIDSTLAKIIAVVLSYICICALVFSAGTTAVMGYYKFYFSNEKTVKEEILTDMAFSEADYIDLLIDEGMNLETYYEDKNVFYLVTDIGSGKTVHTNYKGESYIVSGRSTYHYYNEYEVTDENGNTYWEGEAIPTYDITVYVAEDMKHNDRFSVMAKIVEIGFNLRYSMIFIAIAALIILITVLCFLYCAAGHKNGEIRLNPFDKIPFDIYTAFVGLAAVLSFIPVVDGADGSMLWIIVTFFVLTIDYFIALGYTMTFAARIKTATLFKNTAIARLLKFIWKHLSRFFKWLGLIFGNLSLIKKTVFVILAVLAVEFIWALFVLNRWLYADEIIFTFMVPANIVAVCLVLYLALIFKKIKDGGERIAKGDLQHKIDTDYMYGDFKEFAESLNNINDGLKNAVNEQMKSERFKTELITNVSHDIKTPLTSIINYVDLIKKEEPENENVKQYIEVLDRQSAILKKLVEDLVEASKASTGVLKVDLSECDPAVLLTQTAGEFEERLKKADITPVINLPENPIRIMADGRHLWRVFDNLMSNICKYAMPGTRAYLDVKQVGSRAEITLRNISKYQLNVTADELMERFVRGDSSRNTEGSGLGLSIARSLVELQGGKMEITIDGDLYKVTVSFDNIM